MPISSCFCFILEIKHAQDLRFNLLHLQVVVMVMVAVVASSASLYAGQNDLLSDTTVSLSDRIDAECS